MGSGQIAQDLDLAALLHVPADSNTVAARDTGRLHNALAPDVARDVDVANECDCAGQHVLVVTASDEGAGVAVATHSFCDPNPSRMSITFEDTPCFQSSENACVLGVHVAVQIVA